MDTFSAEFLGAGARMRCGIMPWATIYFLILHLTYILYNRVFSLLFSLFILTKVDVKPVDMI